MVVALIGLLGALIGGVLVTAGDLLIRRQERRTAQVDALRSAAADLITTYLKTRAYLQARTRADHELHWQEMWPDDRYVAYARFFTLPGSEQFQISVNAIREATWRIYSEQDSSQMQNRYDEQYKAITDFEHEIRGLGA